MATYFLESSALVKRYVNEVGSGWVNSLVSPTAGNLVHLASLTGVEALSATTRRQRGGTISAADAALLDALRGADAVQLAAALEVQHDCLAAGESLIVVSADAELNAAAVAEGLTVDDPNNHP